MFCKWCGSTIQAFDQKCPSCGRETPAMSDCGGFYHLKQRSSAPMPVTKPCPVTERGEPKSNRDRKAAKAHHAVTLIGMAGILLSVALVAGTVFKMQGKLEKLETQGQEQSSGEEREIQSFAVDIAIEGADVTTSHDFGGYAQKIVATTAWTTRGAAEILNISYGIQNEKRSFVDLSFSQEEDQDGNRKILSDCSTDLPLFEKCKASYTWQYCNSKGEWEDVDEKMVINDGCGISCDRDWLEQAADKQLSVDFQCSIQMENKNGDTMTVTVNITTPKTQGGHVS